MQNWVKSFFSSADKFLDILNLGRMIFYTSAGLLAAFPLMMILKLVTMPPSTGYFSSLAETAGGVGNHPWMVFFVALVVGFLVAQVAFHTIGNPLFKRASKENADYVPGTYSFNYRYPQLRNDHEEHDYQSWLIFEYFRYVEIATILPLGAYLGLGGLLGFTLVFLLMFAVPSGSMTMAYPALLTSLVLLISMPVLRYSFWPNFWVKRVLSPTLATYVRAKIALIKGLEDFGDQSVASSPSAPPAKQATK